MEDTVKYILELKDEMSAHLETINKNVLKMNKSMHDSHNIVGELQKRFLAFFAVEKVIEFGKESVKAYDEMRQAQVQLANALSNRDIGVTADELTEKAEEYSKKWIFTKDQILAAQVELTNFRNLAGEAYDRAEQVAINIASKSGGDLKQITADIGRALNTPQMGIRLLRQFGVSFSKQQRELLTSLAETGQMAKAQDMIFRQLEETYRGAADAAASTEEGQRKLAEHGFEEMKEEIGAIITEIEMALLPDFKAMVQYIRDNIVPALRVWVGYLKDIIGWMHEHAALVKSVAILVASYMSIVKALELAKAAQVAFNSAASINPYVAAIAGAIALLNYVRELREAYDEAAAAKNNLIADASQVRYQHRFDVIKTEIEHINKLANSYKTLGREQAIAKAVQEETSALVKLIQESVPGSAQAAELMRKFTALKQIGTSDYGKLFPNIGKAKAGGGGTADSGMANEKVTGQKMTNIYVNITNLVKEFTISSVKNIQESEGKIREIVVKALVSAVNDGQILAGQ